MLRFKESQDHKNLITIYNHNYIISKYMDQWIKVEDKLPQKGQEVLCMVELEFEGYVPVIRWRSVYDEAVVDRNGFNIYPHEIRVVAWLPIPHYDKNSY